MYNLNIYCLIITYNASAWLYKSIGNLSSSTVPVNIIVIDNGSTDGTQQLIKTHYPAVDFIQSETNLGFGKANNIGIKKAHEAGADFVFLLNQDAWVENDTIEKLVNIAEKKPEYGIVSPMHLNGKGAALDFRFSHYISPAKCPKLVSDTFLNKTINDIYETKFVNAAAWLISRQCIETIGGFNPIFHMYGEDDNYIHRAHYHGFKVGIYPFAKIYHDREDKNTTISENQYKKDIKKSLLVKYSNPNIPNTITQEIKWVKRGIIKSLLKADMEQFKNERSKLKLINKIKREVTFNTKISKQKGLSFLN